MNNVIHLTAERRREHYFNRLQYIGPTKQARCACGATRSRWWVRRVREHGDHRVTNYRCRCGRPVLKVDAL